MAHIMTTKELSQYRKLHQITISKYAAASIIPAIRIGRVWRFDKDLIDTWIRTGRNEPETDERPQRIGASKILFAALPEVALPIDNNQWLNVFRTIDYGDIIMAMATEIAKWEERSGQLLNDLPNPFQIVPSHSISLECRKGKICQLIWN